MKPQVPHGFSVSSVSVANNGNSQVESILKTFMQEIKAFVTEAKNQIQVDKVSFKNLETKMGKFPQHLAQEQRLIFLTPLKLMS